MPRFKRLFLPDWPLHIVQRGHDRQAVFQRSEDHAYYLANLLEMKKELAVKVYGYCLMTNHVHLIVAPGDDVFAVSKMMRTLAGRQTRYVNKRENRTGTLWEGRFKASLIDTDSYLLACSRYVDLNPVRASLVAVAERYQWSSYRHRIGLRLDDLLDDHDVFNGLGRDRDSRARAYEVFVANGTSDAELSVIRTAVRRNQLTGDDQFKAAIGCRTGRQISSRGQGRPGANQQRVTAK